MSRTWRPCLPISVVPSGFRGRPGYPGLEEGSAMWFWILLAVVAAAFVVYKFRVPVLARALGQPEARIRGAIDRRKAPRSG